MGKIFCRSGLVLVCLALLLGAHNAAAVNLAEHYELSPFVGAYQFDDDLDREVEPVLGAHLGYWFTRSLSAELSLEGLSGEMDTGEDAGLFAGHLDALYHFHFTERVIPYLVGGAGVARYTSDRAGAEDTNPLVNYGAGLKLMLNDWLIGRLDVRQPVTFSRTDFNLMYTAGVSFLFGGPSAPEPAAPPSFSFVGGRQQVVEDVGNLTVTAQLSEPAPSDVVIPLTFAGSATRGEDYILEGDSLTIPAGEREAARTLRIVDDDLVEPLEDIELHAGAPIGAALGAATVHIIEIIDNDTLPLVGFAPARDTRDEGAGRVLTRVVLSSPAPREVVVPFSVGGDATAGRDFTLAEGPLRIPAGASGADVVVTLLDDDLDEPDETLVLLMGEPQHAQLGAATQYTLTITDNDQVPVAPGLMERIHFAFDRSDLRTKAREVLANNYEYLVANPRVRLRIEGHCDERGSVEYNLALGERRARAARQYLIDLGIDPARLEMVSFGKEQPLVPEHNEDAWTMNRRAEFVVLEH